MKRNRPRIFALLAIAFVLIALSFPLQIALLYEHGPGEWRAILHKLTILNWLVMAGLLVGAGLVFRASPWLRRFVPALIGLVGLNNFLVGWLATDYSLTVSTAATLAFAALTLPLHRPHVASWWRAHERRRARLPVHLSASELMQFDGLTFDLSEGGVFIPLAAEGSLRDADYGNWQPDQFLTLEIDLPQGRRWQCAARVVRRAEARGRYPAGIGLQFLSLSRRQRGQLRRYLETLDA